MFAPRIASIKKFWVLCHVYFLIFLSVQYASANPDQGFTQTALTGSLRELADFSAEIAPLNEVRIVDQFALIYAARNFEPARLEVIIKSHTSLDITDETGTTAVMHALMAGRIENAQMLHDWGASLEGINDQGYTVRGLAEEAGLPDFGPVYETSLPGPTVDHEDANELLLLAAEAGDTALVDWALSLGADLSAKADNGLQAAHLAALGGHEGTFGHILKHETAPPLWAIVDGGQEMTLADFIIAGEGGGDHESAGRMLALALQTPAIAGPILKQSDRYRDAMMNVGYTLELIVSLFGAPAPPDWDIGIPASGSVQGGTKGEWKDLQRFLASEGLYTGEIDGVPGRGTLRGVIFHTAKQLQDLIDRVDVVQDISKIDAEGPRWTRANGRLHLALETDEAGHPQGYTLSLPADREEPTRIDFTPQGQSYSFRSSEGGSTGPSHVEFTYSAPEDRHVARLSLPVLGKTLDVLFYPGRFEYKLQGVTRQYVGDEDVPWVVGLDVSDKSKSRTDLEARSVADLPEWDIGLPVFMTSGVRGGTPEEWRALQSELAEAGLYNGKIDGVPGRGTQLAIVKNAVQELPNLINAVEQLYDLSRLPGGDTGTDWQKIRWGGSDRWRLALEANEGMFGYALVLPVGTDPAGAFPSPIAEFQGQVYRYNGRRPSGLVRNDIEFTYAPPDRDYRALLRMVVMGRPLAVMFYDDRTRYIWEGSPKPGQDYRWYVTTEEIPWPDALFPIR